MSDFDENLLKDLLPPNFEERAKTAFEKYDTNKDGVIDVKELLVLMKEVANEFNYSEPVTKEDAQKALDELDLNHNGKLEFEEFKKLFIGLCVVREVNKK